MIPTISSLRPSTVSARPTIGPAPKVVCHSSYDMELPVARTLNADDEVRQAANDRIRLLSVAHADSPEPLGTFSTPVAWRAAAPDTVRDFSGACFYFARELQKTIPVPMGLIHASWGGSNIEAWISARGLETMSSATRISSLARR